MVRGLLKDCHLSGFLIDEQLQILVFCDQSVRLEVSFAAGIENRRLDNMIRAKLVKSRILTGSRNLRSSRGLEPYNLKVSSM